LLPLSNVSEAVGRLSGGIDALYILVNEGGTLVDANRPPSEARVEDIRSNFEVNLFGLRVTQALVPLRSRLSFREAARVLDIFAGVNRRPNLHAGTRAKLNLAA